MTDRARETLPLGAARIVEDLERCRRLDVVEFHYCDYWEPDEHLGLGLVAWVAVTSSQYRPGRYDLSYLHRLRVDVHLRSLAMPGALELPLAIAKLTDALEIIDYARDDRLTFERFLVDREALIAAHFANWRPERGSYLAHIRKVKIRGAGS